MILLGTITVFNYNYIYFTIKNYNYPSLLEVLEEALEVAQKAFLGGTGGIGIGSNAAPCSLSPGGSSVDLCFGFERINTINLVISFHFSFFTCLSLFHISLLTLKMTIKEKQQWAALMTSEKNEKWQVKSDKWKVKSKK